MSATPLVVIGAGGFGREVLDVIEAVNDQGSRLSSSGAFEFLGFLDDGSPDQARLKRRRAPLLGAVSTAEDLPPGTAYVLGIGHPELRASMARRLTSYGVEPATLVHPSAVIGGDVELGVGTIVCAHVSITTNVRLGIHTHLNLNVTVGHDTRGGDYVTVFPGATISGDVVLGDRVSVGTNAAIIQGISVGSGTTIGAGAAVVRDLQENVTAVGVPARPLSDVV